MPLVLLITKSTQRECGTACLLSSTQLNTPLFLSWLLSMQKCWKQVTPSVNTEDASWDPDFLPILRLWFTGVTKACQFDTSPRQPLRRQRKVVPSAASLTQMAGMLWIHPERKAGRLTQKLFLVDLRHTKEESNPVLFFFISYKTWKLISFGLSHGNKQTVKLNLCFS